MSGFINAESIDPRLLDFSVRLMFALLHFLWQGIVAAALIIAAHYVLRRHSANVRYVLNMSVLLALACCLPVTFLITELPASLAPNDELQSKSSQPHSSSGPIDDALYQPPGGSAFTRDRVRNSSIPSSRLLPSEIDGLDVESDSASTATATSDSLSTLKTDAVTEPVQADGWLTTAALVLMSIYIIGVFVMLIRLAVSVWKGHRLRTNSETANDSALTEILTTLSNQMNLRIIPAARLCSNITVPVVVGIIRPVLLFPGSLLTGLDEHQLKAVISHELAHIRRMDLVFNLLQRLLEAVLFFHPAVWFISHRISTEREASCDDLAVATGCEKTQYAGALIRVAELSSVGRASQLMPRLSALQATGMSSSEFGQRVRRLLGDDQLPKPYNFRAFVAMLLILTMGGVIAAAWPGNSDDAQNSTASDDTAAADDSTANPFEPAKLPTWNESPQWGGSSLRNHVTECKDLPTSIDVQNETNILWTAELGDTVYNTPVVAGGKVYIGTSNAGHVARHPMKEVDLGVLLCFDEKTGEFLWQHSVSKRSKPGDMTSQFLDWPMQGMCSAPCVNGDRLWVVTNRAEVICLDTNGFHDETNDGPMQSEEHVDQNDSDVIWSYDLHEQLGVTPHYVTSTSPTIVGDYLLVGTSHGIPAFGTNGVTWPDANPSAPSFIAFNCHTGEVVWQDNSPGTNILDGQWSSPAFDVIDGVPQAVFAAGDGWLYSFDMRDIARGESNLLWKFDCNPKTSQYQLGNGQGERNSIIATPVIDDDRVYIATGRNPEHGEGPGIAWCIDATKRGDISETLVFSKDSPETAVPPRRFQSCDPEKGEFERPNPNSGVIWKYTGTDLNDNGKLEIEESMHRATSSVTVHDGLAVVADFAGIMHCIDAATGQGLWTYDAWAAMGGTPLINEDRIYVADEDGDVAILRLSRTFGGVESFSTQNSINGSLVAANDRLFIPQKKQLLVVSNEDVDKQEADPAPALWQGLHEDGSAIAFQTPYDMHFLLFHDGLMTSNITSEYSSSRKGQISWTHEGNISLLKKSANHVVRSFRFSAQAGAPDVVIIDGNKLDLNNGRLIVLQSDGQINQLECGSTIDDHKDIQQLASYVRGSQKESSQ